MTTPFATHEVFNQSPPLQDVNLFTSDRALIEAVNREGGVSAVRRLTAFGAAWCVGTFIPFVIQASAFDRISYLYYMLLVMPGIYMATAWLFCAGRNWS